MEHRNSGKLLDGENSISERRETVIVQTSAKEIVTTPPNEHASGGKMEVRLLQYENGGKEEDEDEGELEDVQDTLKTNCGSSTRCSELLQALNECNDRVNSREKTLETCEQELFDFIDCVNACVVKELFNHLK